MTKQRAAILACLSKHPGHYTAAEIYALAKKEYPSLSRATVYNALPSLTDEGKLKKIQTDANTAVYDTTVRPHPHLFCPVCGKWEDTSLPDIDREVGRLFGEGTAYTLSVLRICKDCQNKN